MRNHPGFEPSTILELNAKQTSELPLIAILRDLKARLRMGLKHARERVRGSCRFHARHQSSDRGKHNHSWSEVTTPIRRRGNAPSGFEHRIHNMRLAARTIHGLLLAPGQIFAFWRRVPRPCPGNGFTPGPVFLDGNVATSVGGGLCQVSTTLFGAFLEAGLEILERENHSIDPWGEDRFVDLGRDAAVAYGYKDLVVRNPSDVALRLHLGVNVPVPTLNPERGERNTVTAGVQGTIARPFEIAITSRVLEELPPAGPRGSSGWRVETIRRRDAEVDYHAVDLYRPWEGR